MPMSVWVKAMTTEVTPVTASTAASGRAGGVQAQTQAPRPAAAASGDSVQLSPEAQAQLVKLQARDADVRAHEEAHVAAGGSLITGGPTYTYERGPDGKEYAVGGDVTINTAAVPGNPRATLARAQEIVAAALAPRDPSGQDEDVAAEAEAMAATAMTQIAAAGTAGAGQAGKSAGSLVDIVG
jgi:hypothetical protein